MVRTFGQVTIINVGTLFREHSPCFAVIDFEAGRVQYIDVASGSFVQAASFEIGTVDSK